jgi:hypothetical protein
VLFCIPTTSTVVQFPETVAGTTTDPTTVTGSLVGIDPVLSSAVHPPGQAMVEAFPKPML